MNKKSLFRLSFVLLFALLLGLVMAGCKGKVDEAAVQEVSNAVETAEAGSEGSETVAADPAFHGIEWQWYELSGTAVNPAKNIPNPENYTITFNPDGTFNGKADCNQIAGTYSRENGGFSITLGPSTQAACAEGSMDQEYLRLLGSVAAGGPSGDDLALESAGGAERMVFRNSANVAPVSDASLHGIEWQWTELAGTAVNPAKTIANPENYTLVFSADGTFSGKADCNQIAGTYSQENGGFTLTLGPSTLAACGEGSMDQEYLRLLSNVAAGGPSGNELILETGGGAERMTFVNSTSPQ